MTTAEPTRREGQHWEPLGSDRVARIRYETGDLVTEDLARETMVHAGRHRTVPAGALPVDLAVA